MTEKVEYILSLRDGISGKMRGMQGNFRRLGNSVDNVKRRIGGLSTAMGGLIGIGAVTMITKGFISLGTQMVRTKTQFEVLTGSIGKADSLLDQLNETASHTPFEQQDLYNAAQTLLAFGTETEIVNERLLMMGDIAGGSRDKLKSLALVMGQITSLGRLQGQDLLQLINIGYNPLNDIVEATGMSMGDLKDAMQKGKISSDLVMLAFKRATSEGGRFHQMMEKMSKTAEGKWSTIMGNLKLSISDIAKDALESKGTINILDMINDKILEINEGGKGFGIVAGLGTGVAIGGITAILGTIIAMFGPAGVIVSSIVVGLGIGVERYFNSPKFKAVADGMFEGVGGVFNRLMKMDPIDESTRRKTAMTANRAFDKGDIRGGFMEMMFPGYLEGRDKSLEESKRKEAAELLKKNTSSFNFRSEDYYEKLKTVDSDGLSFYDIMSGKVPQKNIDTTNQSKSKTIEEQMLDAFNKATESSSSKKVKTHAFQAVGQGGDVSLTIEKVIESIHITSSDDDLDMLENKIKTLVINAIRDASLQYR